MEQLLRLHSVLFLTKIDASLYPAQKDGGSGVGSDNVGNDVMSSLGKDGVIDSVTVIFLDTIRYGECLAVVTNLAVSLASSGRGMPV